MVTGLKAEGEEGLREEGVKEWVDGVREERWGSMDETGRGGPYQGAKEGETRARGAGAEAVAGTAGRCAGHKGNYSGSLCRQQSSATALQMHRCSQRKSRGAPNKGSVQWGRPGPSSS